MAVGAGIDISDIRKPTTAGIDASAQVRTAGDVSVNALSNRSIDSIAVAGSAAGGFGVSGGVSILNLGAPILPRQITIKDSNNNDKQISTLDALGQTNRKVDEILTKAPISKAAVTAVFDFVSALPSGTTAYINGTVNAGKSITVFADATANANALAGALGIGLNLGAGEGVPS